MPELDDHGHSPGDLLVFKGIIDHWAVYAGSDRIIHYNNTEEEPLKAVIVEETIQSFWERQRDSSGTGSVLEIMNSSAAAVSRSGQACYWKIFPKEEPKLGILERRIHTQQFSGEAIVQRARQYLGRTHYNLVFENCETFAKWCKYGVHMSEQTQTAGLTVSVGIGTGGGVAIGALAGAAAGTVLFPVVGTAVGAFVGGLAGAPIGAGIFGVGGWAANQLIRKAKSDEDEFGN